MLIICLFPVVLLYISRIYACNFGKFKICSNTAWNLCGVYGSVDRNLGFFVFNSTLNQHINRDILPDFICVLKRCLQCAFSWYVCVKVKNSHVFIPADKHGNTSFSYKPCLLGFKWAFIYCLVNKLCKEFHIVSHSVHPYQSIKDELWFKYMCWHDSAVEQVLCLTVCM